MNFLLPLAAFGIAIGPHVTSPAGAIPRRCGPQPSDNPLWGIADTHAHQFANLAFGGMLFWGKPFEPDGNAARALANCAPAHGQDGLRDLIGGLLNGQLAGHSTNGYPRLTSWPSWNTIDHQMMYVDWLYRAYRGGLRLMVMHAVNAEAICDLPIVRKQRGRTCDDMEAVDLELDGAKQLEAYLDRVSGGPGRGWYRIAYSPDDAREIIQAGKLAVVLGIEVDDIFGCKVRGPCTEQSVQAAVQKYYDKGVRHLFPIHLANNAFGGSALFGTFFDYNNYKLTKKFPDTFNCSSVGFEYHLEKPAPPVPVVLRLLGSGKQPNYPPGPTCNNAGLTSLGEFLIKELMRHGMLFEVDHMSYLAERRAIELAGAEQYPVVAGHAEFLGASIGQNRSEYQKTDAQLQAIRRSGGMTSVLLNQGLPGQIRQWVDPASGDSVPNDCPSSSKMWAQAYLYAVNRMGGAADAAVGFASDQSLYAWLGPRFGPKGCARRGDPQLRPVSYPFAMRDTSFEAMRSGDRTFDFNTEGFANIGLLPDFVADLKNIGLSDAQLAPLFRSADAYVRTWTRATEAGKRLSQGDF
jgi:microsomal dipeptidase-like Zn-dependent dipeptidase